MTTEDEHDDGQLAGDDELCARLIEEIDDTNAILERVRRRPAVRAQVARLLRPRVILHRRGESPPPSDV